MSGSLSRAMQAGRACVVSATGTYLDIPDDMVARVGAGPADPAELAATLRRLVENPGERRRLGDAAAASIAARAEEEATAHGYATAIEATLELIRDPVRTAIARWGGALVDVGVDEGMVREGYGLSYAAAFEDFTSSP